MVLIHAEIEIADLAKTLEDRKNQERKVALLLGSRTGALFRSQLFYEEMGVYSKRNFSEMSQRECFKECYKVLHSQEENIGRRNLKNTLDTILRSVECSKTDDFLAELVQQRIFKIIISANIDDLLYDAFVSAGMRDEQDFVNFSLGGLSFQEGYIEEHLNEIVTYYKFNTCKIVKIYEDANIFVDNLNKKHIQEMYSHSIRNLLDKLKIEEVIVVGFDPIWDAAIFSAFSPKVKTIWFVNEDKDIKDTFANHYNKVENFWYVNGSSGSYEKFFLELHWHVNREYSRYNDINRELIQKMRLMQNQMLEIQNQIHTLSVTLADKSKHTIKPVTNTNGKEKGKPKMKADVLLVTVSDCEVQAVLDCSPTYEKRIIHDTTYYDFGLIGEAQVFMVQAREMGSRGTDGSRGTVEEGIQALSPKSVIMVGIAFGLKADDHKIGDILVSQRLLDYEHQRVGTNPSNQPTIYLRGERVMASRRLIDRFLAGRFEIPKQWSNPPGIRIGLILSGSKLVDHEGYRDELRRIVPDALGGEMEGMGLYEAASQKKVDWILVKAISDWGDGKKHEHEKENQKLAAENAARFTFYVIQQEGFIGQKSRNRM